MQKIKIIFVHYKLVCGGAEQALFDLINLLDKEKFYPMVFAQNPGGKWDEKFWNAGIRVDYDYTCRKPTWNPIVKLANLRKKYLIQRSLRNQSKGLLDICCPGADIVVDYASWCGDEIGFAKGAKTVKYVHGDPGTNPAYRDEAVNSKERLARYDRVVCVSKNAVKAFQRLSGLSDHVEMHYNPMNSQLVREKAQASIDLPEDLPIICAVGRLSAEKGFERLILAHKSLLDKNIRHRLVIVGDGPDRDFLPRLVRAAGVEDTVILAGYQANPYPYMKKSRFMVNSSFTEGLPVIAMEALTLGVPIVTSIPSVGEAFGDEFCGLITENSVRGLEEGIQKMLTDADLYARAKEGAQHRSTYFDGKRMVKEVEEMFLSLMEENA